MFVPRPVWIVEGQSSDPYYNFGKVIMYFDKEMYRIYWKLVHNRAGEYFYTAMCGYHFVEERRRQLLGGVPEPGVGVNDKTNRAALGGRYQSSFLEQKLGPDVLLAAHAHAHDRLMRAALRPRRVLPPGRPRRRRAAARRAPRPRAQGPWESGYGANCYNVVGRLRTRAATPLAYVKLRIDALDAAGKVVASTETYNESAEVLDRPRGEPEGAPRRGQGEAARGRRRGALPRQLPQGRDAPLQGLPRHGHRRPSVSVTPLTAGGDAAGGAGRGCRGRRRPAAIGARYELASPSPHARPRA